MKTLLVRLAALAGFLSVALGALGAHALRDTLGERGLPAWHTATQYLLAHATACLALAGWAAAQPTRAQRLGRVVALWLFGCLLFSGSLYGLALGGPRLLGPITPVGGVAFLIGWLLLALEAGNRCACEPPSGAPDKSGS